MSEIKYNKYDKPIVKSVDQLEKGDVLRFAYGDFDNIVTVAVDHIEDDQTDEFIKIVGNYVSTGTEYEGYSPKYYNSQEVIGHVIE